MNSLNNLPPKMKNKVVEKYFLVLKKKYIFFFLKRVFDILASLLLIVLLLPLMFILAIIIKIDSRGPVLYKQVRITKYYKEFKIYKFRTMHVTNNQSAIQITVGEDIRITRIGRLIRKSRLDELPQLLNILIGDMSFVGPRPEVPKYTHFYSDEMLATLLVRAGVTSWASINYKDEARLLEKSMDPEKEYIETILPAKMKLNLDELYKMNIFYDLKVLFLTVIKVIR